MEKKVYQTYSEYSSILLESNFNIKCIFFYSVREISKNGNSYELFTFLFFIVDGILTWNQLKLLDINFVMNKKNAANSSDIK